ncbi:MAG: copper chaperone [Proteobacteria bacterium]|nr:copper chaperone [Pseudomonadota bacterium]
MKAVLLTLTRAWVGRVCPQRAVGHPDAPRPRRRGEDTAPYPPLVQGFNARTFVPQVLALFASAICLTAADHPPVPVPASATNQFRITGMNCEGCSGGLQAELRLLPGVARANVVLTNGLAIVAYDTNRVNAARLLKVIEEAGFKGTLVQP